MFYLSLSDVPGVNVLMRKTEKSTKTLCSRIHGKRDESSFSHSGLDLPTLAYISLLSLRFKSINGRRAPFLAQNCLFSSHRFVRYGDEKEKRGIYRFRKETFFQLAPSKSESFHFVFTILFLIHFVNGVYCTASTAFGLKKWAQPTLPSSWYCSRIWEWTCTSNLQRFVCEHLHQICVWFFSTLSIGTITK